MKTFATIIKEATDYLEKNRKCGKHHVEHTGSNAYLLDFYSYLGEIQKGKELIKYLLTLVVDNGEGGKVFYPGHMNPMNMSQNVIDTGTAIDAIARFAYNNRAVFTADEHSRMESILREVVETYLVSAAHGKKVTNQRLWGLTGLSSFAKYVGEEEKYKKIVIGSVEKAFSDMTIDGFFRYYPDPYDRSLPYDDITAFYQSRHTAFIQYSLKSVGIDVKTYREKLEKSTAALLSMYTNKGWKDMRMECKRWYWLSSYEVASHSFDAYALSFSNIPETEIALNNVLYQIREHFFDRKLHSHKGLPVNFQCSIFWTAHLAWLTRIPDIEELFNTSNTLVPFKYKFSGKEIFTQVMDGKRILINTRFKPRNPTTGIFDNGIKCNGYWRLQVPLLPHAFLFSVRETVNHTWYALRGGYFIEALSRSLRFLRELFVMTLPYYSVRYGKIESFDNTSSGDIKIQVRPATKYGTLSTGKVKYVLFSNDTFKIIK